MKLYVHVHKYLPHSELLKAMRICGKSPNQCISDVDSVDTLETSRLLLVYMKLDDVTRMTSHHISYEQHMVRELSKLRMRSRRTQIIGQQTNKQT